MTSHVWSSSSFSQPLRLPSPPVQHLVLNQEFTDQYEDIFVIGDVHGCLEELETLLRHAKALLPTTLKILVGDFLNKGPRSLEVLRKIRSEPSYISVRGNHEEAVLSWYHRFQRGNFTLYEKNAWIAQLNKDDVTFLSRLPYTVSLPALNAVIVHAGLLPGVPILNNKPEDMVSMRTVDGCGYTGLWARRDERGIPWAFFWNGPEEIYFGHNSKKGLQECQFATGLDTGCVYGRHLTGVYLNGPYAKFFFMAAAEGAYSPIV